MRRRFGLACATLLACVVVPAVRSQPAEPSAEPPRGDAAAEGGALAPAERPMAAIPALPAPPWPEGSPFARPGREIDPSELVPREPGPGVVTYDMDVRLDPENHQVVGTQRVTWRNDSDEAVPSLWWHLYLNAFTNDRTTMAEEGGVAGRGSRDAEREESREYWGYTLFRSMELSDGTDLLPSLEHVQPDDGNEHDRTVARVVLPRPVLPGESVTILTDFVSDLPFARRRTGWAGDYHFVAQWYPKLAVYEGVAFEPDTEGWNAHQYHRRGEFYAPHGRHRVTITVPEEYGGAEGGKVGASGVRVAESENEDESWTYTWLADPVHDFAWAADPDFVVVDRVFRMEDHLDQRVIAEQRFQRERVGVPAELLDLPDVSVRLLLQPEHAGQAQRHFEAVVQGILWFGLWFGPYPYDTVTVVDPQNDGRATGGMEYPTLFTTRTRWIVPPAPEWPGPEGVTIHEFGHQYFYGLLGSNEREEPWLDEGFTSYADDKAMEAGYGPRSRWSEWSHVWLPIDALLPLPADEDWSAEGILQFRPFGIAEGTWAELGWLHPGLTWAREVPVFDPVGSRRRYVTAGTKDAMDEASWRVLDGASYSAIAYSKPATVLTQLERTLGRDRFQRAVRLWAARHRFAHPTGADFFEVLEETTGLPSEVARRTLRPEVLDYEVASVSSKELDALTGLRPRPGARSDAEVDFIPPSADERAEDGDGGGAGARYRNTIRVRRDGTLTAPVEIAVWMGDEDEPELFTWDGESSWHEIEIVREGKVTRVEVDPHERLTMDVDRLDNSWAAKGSELPAVSWATRVLVMVQSMLLGARSLS